MRRAARLGDGWIGTRSGFDEIAITVARLNSFRAEAGRVDEPFEILVGLRDPPVPERLRRLEDLGVRNILTRPWNRYEGDMSGLAAKERALERFAEDVLVPAAK